MARVTADMAERLHKLELSHKHLIGLLDGNLHCMGKRAVSFICQLNLEKRISDDELYAVIVGEENKKTN